ncbi:MAG: Uma2 family endonuclease [Armatimonadetes bacterium]|nr:Uma2 family endonuclease [Armatimonadota bacterium]
MPDDGVRRELVEGEVITTPSDSGRHGWVGLDIMGPLNVWVKQRGLGQTFQAETGFLQAREPDTVRAPDGAFIAADRFPDLEPPG